MRATDIRSANQLDLIRYIRRHAPVSQSTLADASDLRPSTVSTLMRPLKAARMVEVVGRGHSGTVGGKRPELIALNGAHATFAGVYVRESEIDVYVMDYDGRRTYRETLPVPTPSGDTTGETVVELIAERVLALASEQHHFAGTGVAVSSVVPARGDIEASAGFSWSLPDFRERIASRIGIDTTLIVENNANCAAVYAEQLLERRYESMLAVFADPRARTVGAGILIDGRLYRGARGAAGELWDPHPPCADTGNLWTGPEGFARRVAHHIESTRTVLDPEATVLVVGGHGPQDLGERVRRILRGAGGRPDDGADIECLTDSRAPVAGACLLAARDYEERFVQGGV
ncbi:MAG: ROK family protein [Spirochaetaceae bacterium]